MARIYANKCEYEGLNFNKVPNVQKAKVKKLIEEDGYVIKSDGTVVKVVAYAVEGETEKES